MYNVKNVQIKWCFFSDDSVATEIDQVKLTSSILIIFELYYYSMVFHQVLTASIIQLTSSIPSALLELLINKKKRYKSVNVKTLTKPNFIAYLWRLRKSIRRTGWFLLKWIYRSIKLRSSYILNNNHEIFICKLWSLS